MDRTTFLDVLRQSGLLREEKFAEVSRRFAAESTARPVAVALTAEGVLTAYQSQQLLAGQAAGLVLGQYRILDELGRGGFGRVYKALHTLMGRVVALKVISPELVENSDVRGRFRKEVLAVTQLSHPNIVMAYDANEADGVLFLVLEYVEGYDLDRLVMERGPLPVGLACEMMAQAAQALQHAFEKRMVHRDIKPANLLVPRDTGLVGLPGLRAAPAGAAGPRPVAVKVGDFGLARLHTAAQVNTLLSQGERSFLGTPSYVAPEQAEDLGSVDIRSDLYSLGCTFYYALTSRPPFEGATVFATLIKHRDEEPEPLEALRPEVPAAVAAVVRRLMAKDPKKRFQTPADLAAELAFLCGSEAPRGSGTVVPPAAPRGAPPPRPEAEARGSAALTATQAIPASALHAGVDAAAKRQTASTAPTLTTLPPQETPVQAVPCPDSPPPEAARKSPTPPDPPALPVVSEAVLYDSWRQWTTTIEAIARGADPRRLSEPEYRSLHGRLLEACRSRVGREAGARQDSFRRMEALVEPWLTPQALALADPATLFSLRQRCREVEREAFAAKPAVNFGYWAALLAVVIAVGIGASLGRVQGGMPSVKSLVTSLWRMVEATPLTWTVLVVPVLILLSVRLLSRVLRS